MRLWWCSSNATKHWARLGESGLPMTSPSTWSRKIAPSLKNAVSSENMITSSIMPKCSSWNMPELSLPVLGLCFDLCLYLGMDM